jgi:hypothetical protein
LFWYLDVEFVLGWEKEKKKEKEKKQVEYVSEEELTSARYVLLD